MQLNRKTNKISHKENNDLLTTKKLYGVVKLKNADSLFITGENGPVFFSLKDQRWNPFPVGLPWTTTYLGRYMYEGENNILWICSVGAGLIKYDYRKSTFDIIEPVKVVTGSPARREKEGVRSRLSHTTGSAPGMRISQVRFCSRSRSKTRIRLCWLDYTSMTWPL